jgi:hypothetical protein
MKAQARGRENKGTQLQHKALILVTTSQQASQILAKQKSQKQQLPKQYQKE